MQKARLLTQFSKTTRQVRYSNEILCTAIFVADNTQRVQDNRNFMRSLQATRLLYQVDTISLGNFKTAYPK